jgi:hypothetical protein
LRLLPLDFPRPLERCLVGSLGAEVEESRSTRLDSGVLPVLEDDPLRDPDERLFDFDELPELPERLLVLDRELLERLLLLDRELRCGILAFPVEPCTGRRFFYLCFFRAFSVASATSPICWPIFPMR